MKNMNWDPEQIRDDFLSVARVAGIDIRRDAICIDPLEMPHTPPSLPRGKMAVYVFCDTRNVLKVGRAGPKSGARYKSHHYSPSRAKSTLAASLLRDECAVKRYNLNEENVGGWIMKCTDRVNFLLDANIPKRKWGLNLLEAFVQCRLQPVYEGKQES